MYPTARIFCSESGNQVVGSGWMCDERLLLTCSHVAYAALETRGGEKGYGRVMVDFPFTGENFQVAASVVKNIPLGSPTGGDIALLRIPLGEKLPAKLQPAPLGVSRVDMHISAWGFPEESQNKGQWAHGRAREARPDGWVDIEGADPYGYWVEPGFSGTAVWDATRTFVVGMLAAVELSRSKRVAFMIPTELALRALCTAESGQRISELAERFDADRNGIAKNWQKIFSDETNEIGLKGTARAIADMLEPGENVIEACLSARAGIPGTNWLFGALVCTDRRIAYVYKVPFASSSIKEIEYSSLRHVRKSGGRMGGALTREVVEMIGDSIKINLTEWKQSERMHRIVAYAMSKIPGEQRSTVF
jgi:hypothetical protein